MSDQLTLFHMPGIAPARPELYRYCGDCDADVFELAEWYMVRDEVWPIPSDRGVLCVRCVEIRLGRRLAPKDFTDAACNRSDYRSARLKERMGCEAAKGQTSR